MVKLSSQKKMGGREEIASKQMNRELKACEVSPLYVPRRHCNLTSSMSRSLVNAIDVVLARQRHRARQRHCVRQRHQCRGRMLDDVECLPVNVLFSTILEILS